MIALIELVNEEKKASKRADKLIHRKMPLSRRRYQMHHICSLGTPADISSGEEYTGTARVQISNRSDRPSTTYLRGITNHLIRACLGCQRGMHFYQAAKHKDKKIKNDSIESRSKTHRSKLENAVTD